MSRTTGAHFLAKVGIVDTGLSWERYPEEFELHRIAVCTSLVGGSGLDSSGHGTKVASRIAGRVSGFGYWSGICSYRCMDPGESVASVLAVCAAIDRATQDGVQIINLSMMVRGDELALRRECRRARDAGVLIVASSVPGGSWPADYDGVLAVGYEDSRRQVSADLVDMGRSVTVCGGRTVSGVSYATARVSGLLINAVERLMQAGQVFDVEDFWRALPDLREDGCLDTARLHEWVTKASELNKV